MATRSTNVESDESTMSQNAVVSCNRRLLAPAIARTRLNIHLRSEDFVRIVLRGEGTHDSTRPLGKKAPDALHIAAVLISEALDQIPLLRAGPQRQERERQACCYREQPCSQRQPQAHP